MQKKKSTHLTLDERIRIETLLREDYSLRYIADRLDKSPSTISREISKHAQLHAPVCCDCLNSPDCTLHHVCGSSGCRKKCKSCRKAKLYCCDYVQAQCDDLLNHPLRLCNSCRRQRCCHFEKHLYNAKTADKEYRSALVSSRDGFDLTASQFQKINDIVTPLVKKGQSIYHIANANRDSLPVSESTIRRLINAGELDVCRLDLPEAVKRRPRKKSRTHPAPPAAKTGHLYQDYLAYTRHNDAPVVQMDCVEGAKDDHAVILTLHFVMFHMQLLFILDEHSSSAVVALLDILEETLGRELFASCFPLILTDNGQEFSDIAGMERSIYGKERTRVFFCDPHRSDQKAECENNHRLLRDIVPKGTSLERFMQSDMTLAANHLNSYVRKSLFGRCPYDLAMSAL
ncbi:MAG: IS30 family transposase, partial [Lachnoclostridium sp.]|nr:IS30 family transposase [Lachnoclostridium sp.]